MTGALNAFKKPAFLLLILLAASIVLSSCEYKKEIIVTSKSRELTLASLENIIHKEMFKNIYYLGTLSELKSGLMVYYPVDKSQHPYAEIRIIISKNGYNSYKININASGFVTEDPARKLIDESEANILNIVEKQSWEEMKFDNPDLKIEINR